MKDELEELDDLIADDDDCPWCEMFRIEEIDDPFEYLESRGVALPDPALLNDAMLHEVLWKLAVALAANGVMLECTDHLSDRELYEFLWGNVLRNPLGLTDDPYSTCHVSPVGDCEEEDNLTYLRFYADEAMRERWKKMFPDAVVPEHEDPPYRRDQLLASIRYDREDVQ